MRAESGKAERLFRAAISAFCSLTRPSRREIAQLEDLTLPMFEDVSVEARRFAAAALSECEYAPSALVRRLCEEPVDIAAPLLVRSSAVSDIDMIALIGRYGLPHAKAISRRKDLNPTISDLIKALEKPTLVRPRKPETPAKAEAVTASIAVVPSVAAPAPARVEDAPAPVAMVAAAPGEDRLPGDAAEKTRHRLRAIMAGEAQAEGATVNPFIGPEAYVKLRETALTGNAAFFQTALADALDIDFSTARTITATSSYSSLVTALRALDLSEDKAFLIAVAIFPTQFPHPQAIRLFLERFRLLHRDAALDRVRDWRAEKLSRSIRAEDREAANGDKPATASVRPAKVANLRA